MPRQKWANPSGTREYYAWRSMRSRCSNPKHVAWKNYGGRGIRVCARWENSYDNFLSDMGPCPVGMTLERIDSDKGYFPENCRWADWVVQGNNKRTNIKISHTGQTKTLAQWARSLGLRVDTLHKRLKRMGPEKALTPENLVEKNASPLVHGTRVGYEKYRCRCRECRDENARRHREYMKKKSNKARRGAG